MRPAAFCLAVALSITGLATAQSNTVHVTWTVSSTWAGGYQAAIGITNNATWTIPAWQLAFDLPDSITSLWDGTIVSHVGGHYVVAGPAWLVDLHPGITATIGYVASPDPGVQPTNGTLNGSPVVFNGTSPAPPAPTPAPPWPSRALAPFVDATLWPLFDIEHAAQTQGLRWFALGFVVAQGPTDPTPSWGGFYSVASGFRLPQINALRALGGDVIVSFGGAAGTELALSTTSVPILQAAYQDVIDAYGLTHIDFDIEGAAVNEPASVDRRSQAIAGLQATAAAASHELHVQLTLPVLPTGLTAEGVYVVTSALSHGVVLDRVNIMTMDYGAAAPNPAGQMGALAIQACQSLQAQLTTAYQVAGIPKTSQELWHLVGATPMIGQNDVPGEIFGLSDAGLLLAFAEQQDMGFLSFWSLNRDQPCPGGPSTTVSNTCSGVAQDPWGFSHVFKPFTTSTWLDLGHAKPGTHGLPILAGSGSLLPGTPWALALMQGAVTSPAWLVSGGSAASWCPSPT